MTPNNTIVQTATSTTANGSTTSSNSKHFENEYSTRSRASSNANVRNSERSRSVSNASVSSTTISYPNQISNNEHQYEAPVSSNLTQPESLLHHQQQQQQTVSQSRASSCQQQSLSNNTTSNVQQLNLMHPTPQQRLTIERLLQIPPESVQSRNPKLYDLLVQLRRQYMWQAVTTPIPTTIVDKALNGVHPLEKMKQEDAMVFSSHIDEICACVNQLLEEADSEEYGLGQGLGYKAIWVQEEELKAKAKRDILAPPEADQMQDEDGEEECEEEEFEEETEEALDQINPQPSSSTAPTLSNDNCDEEDSCPPLMEDDEEEEEETCCDSEETTQATLNAQSQDASNTKLQEFFRQLENVEPIPNGKLSFFQNHHLVVGKFDKKLLVENNVLSCTVMKKSTLNVVVHRRCTRLKKDSDRTFPFDATSGNYHDRRILKKQSLAKSVVRFAKVKVDFGQIVEEVIRKSTNPVCDETDKK